MLAGDLELKFEELLDRNDQVKQRNTASKIHELLYHLITTLLHDPKNIH
jgi:hypothetical protein